MVTIMFENSLQLVNPMLSLPYWDFTIESYKVDTEHDGDYTKLRDVSDLWTADWFGSVDPEDYMVSGTVDQLSTINTDTTVKLISRTNIVLGAKYILRLSYAKDTTKQKRSASFFFVFFLFVFCVWLLNAFVINMLCTDRPDT